MRTLLSLLLLCLMHHASAQCNPVISTGNSGTYICDGNPAYMQSSPGDTYQWYLNGVAITGATDYYYMADVAGTYIVEVDSVGCIAISAPVLLTTHSKPDTPGIITGNSIFCQGTTQTFSVDPVSGADKYEWSTNAQGQAWIGFWDDSTNTSTTIAGYSANLSSPQTVISVSAVNECGHSAWSNKIVSVHAPPQIGGHDPDPDMLSNGPASYCPTWGATKIHPTTHGNIGGYTSPFTYQWYFENVAIPGATSRDLSITHGGSYTVEIITQQCGTFAVSKFVHQDVPGNMTITPQGPLDFCLNNIQPLQVTFDMTGVDGYGSDFEWMWYRGMSIPDPADQNVYSIVPDTTGIYMIAATGYNAASGQCNIFYPNTILVTVPQPLEVTQIDDTLFATPGYDSYQWFESGNILVGETQQKHTLQFDGFYTVEGVFMNGCVENSSLFDSDFIPPPPPPPPPPGNNPQEPGEEMTISPNPFTNNFMLSAKVAKGDDKATISITDATGRILFEKEVDAIDGVVNEKIDLGDASAIVGTIRLRSAGTLKTERFFKK